MNKIRKDTLTLIPPISKTKLEEEILTHNLGMKERDLTRITNLTFKDFDEIYLTKNYQVVMESKDKQICKCGNTTKLMILEELAPAVRPPSVYPICNSCLELIENDKWFELDKLWKNQWNSVCNEY